LEDVFHGFNSWDEKWGSCDILSYMDTQETTTMISLRIPEALRAELQRRARRNHRTVTGEVLYLLELALNQEHPVAAAPASHSENGAPA
jgi:hypothetical protein